MRSGGILISVFLFGWVACAVAVAADKGPADQPAVSTTEGSGVASSPGTGRCEARFRALDGNGDGAVSKDELLASLHFGKRAGTMFEARDADGDGQLTKVEFCARRRSPAGITRRPLQP
jgi:hypothetical protein